jgi:hypothetical protein
MPTVKKSLRRSPRKAKSPRRKSPRRKSPRRKSPVRKYLGKLHKKKALKPRLSPRRSPTKKMSYGKIKKVLDRYLKLATAR